MGTFWKKRVVAATLAGSMLFLVLGVACDDNNPQNTQKIDEDDTRPGPGDGSDETGPGR